MSRRPSLRWAILLALPLSLGFGLAAGPSGWGWPDPASGAGRAILGLRGVRVGTGFALGAGLSCAGVLMQALLRNPLADPYVLGVSSGGALGAALAIVVLGAGAGGGLAVQFGSFLLAAATLLLVLRLAERPDGAGPSLYGLLLSGVIVAALLSSLLLLFLSLATQEGLRTITWWMLGNLQAQRPWLTAAGAGIIAGASIAACGLARDLDALTLGRDVAYHLGVRTKTTVLVGLGLATLIASVSVALAGLIGFVGLVVPHATRALVGARHRVLIPMSALGGGAFLVVCDALARTMFAPIEIPVGVVTALVGGPFFLYLLRRRRKGWIE